ncbi:MAG TPA: acyl-CoA dehydrogenase family protein [Kofleriaceae bacterium]|nr:acyl-CoA dehydrogenase family protein [Kofleriaceae bacterium]
MTHDDLVARARTAGAAIAPLGDAIEAGRRLPAEAVAALADAGVFKMLVPRAYGGAETSLGTFLRVIEEIARADGSAGWIAMIGASSGLMAAYLDASVAREIYGAPDAVTCGVFAPMGRAERVEGGFNVSGRWAFASGCEHAPWRMGGALVMVPGGPELLPTGAPDVVSMLFRADDTRVLPTWNTSGLCGTGSHDLEVKNVFVPTARTFSLLRDAPRKEHDGEIYRLPFFGVLAAGVAAVAVGIARNAIDLVVALAKVKHPLGAKRGLAHRELVQLQIARAEAKYRGARAFLLEAANDAEAAIASGAPASLSIRARLRLAACHATTEAAAAVDLAYETGGGTSIYATSPLQRCFRDVHVATQHIMVSPTAATLAGRVLLGLESDTSTL